MRRCWSRELLCGYWHRTELHGKYRWVWFTWLPTNERDAGSSPAAIKTSRNQS